MLTVKVCWLLPAPKTCIVVGFELEPPAIELTDEPIWIVLIELEATLEAEIGIATICLAPVAGFVWMA